MAAVLILIAQASETERLLTLHDVTVAGILLAGIIGLIVGFLREWIVTGAQYRRAIAERDAQLERVRADREKWFNLAWQAANTARAGVQTAHEATQTLRAITGNTDGATQPQTQLQPPAGPYGGSD